VDVLPKPKTARGKASGDAVGGSRDSIDGGHVCLVRTGIREVGYSQTSELTGINMVFIFGSFCWPA